MILIFGGAYQGKLAFAAVKYGFLETEILSVEGKNLDFSKRVLYGLENFTHACALEGTDPVNVFRECREKWQDKILVIQDMSTGVVPLSAEIRAWRQENGRLCQYLSREAEEVYRVLCGLGQRLK